MNMAISSGRLFQPTYPVRGTTDYQLDDTPHYFISTHAPREGCDARAISRLVGLRAFQPTHPARGATRVHVLLVGGIRDFNPRTPRGVRRDYLQGGLKTQAGFQSTHPARGATRYHHLNLAGVRRFQSTHPARGATRLDRRSSNSPWPFQSTHPARGATAIKRQVALLWSYFNPRTPRGVRPQDYGAGYRGGDFNPRTPRGVRLSFLACSPL